MRRKLPHIPLWIQWILATSLSIPLAWGMWRLALFMPFMDSPSSIVGLMWFVLVTITFLPLGVSQWAILRRHIRHAVWWMPITAIGVILGLYAAFWGFSWLEQNNFSTGLSYGLGTFVGGVGLGFLQWLILASASKRAYWWIIASGLGWMGSISWFFPYSMRFLFGSSSPGETVGWLILVGASGGTIKGIALAWILDVPRHQDIPPQKR